MAINKLGSAYQSPVTYTAKKTAANNSQTKSSKTDTLTLTKEGQEYLARKQTEKTSTDMQDAFGTKKQDKNTSYIEMEMFMKQLQQADENKSGDSIQDLAKCMKIASRIMHGDKVPLKDQKFLAEKYPELYKNALIFKQHNPEPKKYKSVLDKEDEENGNDNALSQSQGAESPETFLASALEDLGN